MERKPMQNDGGGQKGITKFKKEEHNKTEVKLKGDSGCKCNYCKSRNHLAKDCMLRKRKKRKRK